MTFVSLKYSWNKWTVKLSFIKIAINFVLNDKILFAGNRELVQEFKLGLLVSLGKV